ncbi:IRE protein kinase [Fonsecaea nubica]|uniref:IRE protein kinase n=1 Tax=Fonsecaea nubica TaxID=856822 RepID=A0A178DFU4_9EURO|nr:IRE protein kinase [Fonsecaea nubica]OAL40547.1 IRE protein kinase [Fonsecaea nubica]
MDVRQPGDCKSCLEINIENLIKPSDCYKQGNGYQHSSPLRELALSSKHCLICSIFLRAITKSKHFKDLELQLDQNELWLKLVYWGECRYACTLQVVAITGQQPASTVVDTDFKVSTLKDDPAALVDLTGLDGYIGASRLPWREDVGETTKSNSSFATANRWLKDCLAGNHVPGTGINMRRRLHSFSAIDHERVPEHPRRLIDCFADTRFRGIHDLRPHNNQSDDQASCKLVDATKHHQPYACLSYCWGPAENTPWVTTSFNVARRKISIDQAALPNTLKDAIHINRRLNIRYLWIDALCIVQDSQDEWLIESTKMDSIYGGALVTICAGASCSSESGIFNSKSVSDFEARSEIKQAFRIKSRLQDGRTSVLEFSADHWEDSNPIQGQEYRRGSLQARGWCCQERHLSRRKIFYGSSQLYWECDHLVLKEDGSFDYDYVEPLGHDATPSQQIDTPQQLALSWYNDIIAADYSTRQLSRPSDKLIAIAGLAKYASKMMGSTYIAGVWSHAIREGLLWKRNASTGRHQETYRAPSWSWASQDSAIRFAALGVCDFRWYSEVTSTTTYYRTTDEFGAIESAHMTLRAALLRGRVDMPPFDALARMEYDMAFHLDGIGHGYARMDDSQFFSGQVMAAPLCEPSLSRNRPYFLVLEGPTEKNEYRRIGLGWVDVRWRSLLTRSNRDMHPLKSVDAMQLSKLQKTELFLI